MTKEVLISDMIQRLDTLERELEGKSLRLAWMEEQFREQNKKLNAFVRETERGLRTHGQRLDGAESLARREHG